MNIIKLIKQFWHRNDFVEFATVGKCTFYQNLHTSQVRVGRVIDGKTIVEPFLPSKLSKSTLVNMKIKEQEIKKEITKLEHERS